MNTTGHIFDIQRFSIHDGPGIRTTVFLKGCPLRCAWCHNPEGISPLPLLSFVPARCVGCGDCLRNCPNGTHRIEDGCHTLDRSRCRVCGRCAANCPAKALELVGREATVEEVLREVLRDRPFYETSGGGMTLSGGEPTAQPDFVEALLQEAKKAGVHCCVETCGFAAFSCFERIAPWVDLFLYDLKELDDARHVAFTGVSNRPILENLRRLHARHSRILLRLPLIPGCNDRDDHFAGIARLVEQLPELVGVEILPYHPLGIGKQDRFGLGNGKDLPRQSPGRADVAQWVVRLKSMGVNVSNEGCYAGRQESEFKIQKEYA